VTKNTINTTVNILYYGANTAIRSTDNMPVVNMACNNQWNSEENVSTEQNLSSMNQQASVNGKKSTEMHIQFQY